MKKFRTTLLGISIRQRLIAYFLSAILIPMLFIAAFQYRRSTRRIHIELNQFAQQNLENAEVAITQKLNSVNDLMTLTNINNSLQTIFMSNQPDTLEGAIQELSELESILSGYFISSNYLSMGAGVQPRLYMEQRDSYSRVRYDPQVMSVYNCDPIRQTEWYPRLSNRFTLIGLDMEGGRRGTPVIKVARRLFNTRESMDSVSAAAVMVAELDTDSFVSLLEPYCYTAGSTIYVTDDYGIVILSTDRSCIGTQLEAVGGKEYMVNRHVMTGQGWNLCSTVPMKEINNELRTLDLIYVVILIFCMVFAWLTAMVLSDRISKPIRQLVYSMEHVYSDAEFAIDIEYQQKDEFGYLIHKYREMIEQIQELIDKLYISDLKKKDAELKAKDAELAALQSKINPHFLYNTLDSVHMYALKYKVPKISGMVAALADFYRFSLSKGRDIITIGEELKIIESYFTLQKIRLGDMLEVKWDVPEAVRRCLIVKFTLQPLVENSIEHGLMLRPDEVGRIMIRGWLADDQLILEIADNGAGADTGEINEMLVSTDDRGPSFGIRNVNERIHNFFGQEYGLIYQSNEWSGVTVRLSLPVYRTMGGYYAKNGDC